MKLYIISFGVAILLSMQSFSQNVPIDFEEGGFGADWNWTVFENASNTELEIVNNPDFSTENLSQKVAKFTALQAGAPFAGCETEQGSGIGSFSLNADNSTITIQVWKPVTSDVGIKLVDAGFGSLGEIKVANTLINQWETLTFDFSSMEGIPYTQIVVFPDFQTRLSDNICYFDNLNFGESVPVPAPMEPAPDPLEDEGLVISMFSNSYTNVAVDTWNAAWSQANLEDIQIDGNDTKLYTSLNYSGTEAVGDNVINASPMDLFHMDVWTPNVTQFKIKLVDFGPDGAFDGGDDSEHEIILENFELNSWVSLSIPLDDFSSLNSLDHIAQLIISSGAPVGSGIVYTDNVYFSKTFDSVIEPNAISFKYGPNPTENELLIQSDNSIESISILDITGKVCFQSGDLFKSRVIDLSNLKSGIYFIDVKINGVNKREKLIKE